MTLPFTPEVFLSLFAQYNAAVWPAQIGAWAAGLAIVAATRWPFAGSGRLIAALLAAMWLATGFAYHWTFFATINFVAPVFALFFVVQALLLAWTGIVRGRLAFEFRRDAAGAAAFGAMVWALAVYPLTNLLAGHAWPQMPAFGLTPCPLVIFTMGMLLAIRGPTPWHIVVIPVAWSLVGGSAAWLLAMPEDIALPVAGLGGAVLVTWTNAAWNRRGTA